jgi:glyoxylase-like metal-dependent hydrolase (beta-lactamase superfamily II)
VKPDFPTNNVNLIVAMRIRNFSAKTYDKAQMLCGRCGNHDDWDVEVQEVWHVEKAQRQPAALAVKAIKDPLSDVSDVKLSAPDQTIEKDTVFIIGGEEFHVLCNPGHIHTELSVYHPKSGTLFAGDTIYEGSDLTTRFGGPAEWKEWIRQLNCLKKLEGLLAIIPGHGKLCGPEEIDLSPLPVFIESAYEEERPGDFVRFGFQIKDGS